MAYGITVNAWSHPGLRDLLGQYRSVLSYDATMSLQGTGTLFVYLTSSYKELWSDHGTYAHSSPNTEGDDFNPPRYPIIHRVDLETLRPKKTMDEIIALRKVREFCNITERGVWIRHSYVSY
jgi:hypothetical protein